MNMLMYFRMILTKGIYTYILNNSIHSRSKTIDLQKVDDSIMASMCSKVF